MQSGPGEDAEGYRSATLPVCEPWLPQPGPPAKPGHRAKLTCSDRCRKAASRAHLRAEARQVEEAARRARQERWQVFRPSTRRSLEQLEAQAGARLAEELAEAIRSERARGREPHDPPGDRLLTGA